MRSDTSGQAACRGFNTGHGYVRPPKRPASAAALAAIIIQSCQNDMHGGQSFHFDADMAPYMEGRSEDEVYQAMEALVFNLNSMHSRAGAQVRSQPQPRLRHVPGGRLASKCLLEAYEAGLGRGETPVFPNIIFRVRQASTRARAIKLRPLPARVSRGSQAHEPDLQLHGLLVQRALRFGGLHMGCRTRVIANRHGAAVSAGRGNLSFTSVNLPRLALRADGSEDRFFILLGRCMDLAARQLLHRHNVQSRLRVCDMPFLMGQHIYMGSEELSADDEIAPAIRHGTLSIGFIGLAEALTVLRGAGRGEAIGIAVASDEADAPGYEIVKFMRKRVNEYAEAHDLNFTLLATPAEGLSGRFVAIDRERFGTVLGVTDRAYYTNSFHVPVGTHMSICDKLAREGKYHSLTNAGHISYVELASPPLHNVEAVENIVRAMARADLGYGGINFPIDECLACGYSGVIESVCPACRSGSIRRIRRITGYLSTVDRFNDAKRAELADRMAHTAKGTEGQ